MVCPALGTSLSVTLGWRSWSSSLKFCAACTSGASPSPAPSQNCGMGRPSGSDRSRSIGVFARSCFLLANALTRRGGLISWLRSGRKYPLSTPASLKIEPCCKPRLAAQKPPSEYPAMPQPAPSGWTRRWWRM